MYAIHIRHIGRTPGRGQVDVNDVARALPESKNCFLQHVYAPRRNENGHSGVIYVTGASLWVAGEGVLAAVRRVIGDRHMGADLVTSSNPWAVGMCDATIRVTHLPVTGAGTDRT